MEVWQLESRDCAVIHNLLATSPDPCIESSPWKFEPRKEKVCAERGRREEKERKQIQADGEEQTLKKLPGHRNKTPPTLML